ncbi:MAG: hypothetical protein ACKV2T_07240 [Kofleriaceae bacterium]
MGVMLRVAGRALASIAVIGSIASCGDHTTASSGDAGVTSDARPPGMGGALYFDRNDPDAHDYAKLAVLPAPFGEAEYSVELLIKLDDSFPVGPVPNGTEQQRSNWYDGDPAPYSNSEWWYSGNFLLDGHNNSAFHRGTFSLQFYAGGALRWLIGDNGGAGSGGVWAIEVHPATNQDSLLDGAAHAVALVRRWEGSTSARYEMWIDGVLRASEVSPVRTNMRQWWTDWSDFPPNQDGWFWGAEKQAAIGSLPQYEDYKGLLADLRLWPRALSAQEIATPGPDGNGVARFQFGEGSGDSTCADQAVPCMSLFNIDGSDWRAAP